MKSILIFFILIFLVSCENSVRIDRSGSVSQGNSKTPETPDAKLNISAYIFPNQILDGQQTVATLTLGQVATSNKTIYFEIVDENGDLADDYFVNHTGSLVIPAGNQSGQIFLTSVPNSMPTGEKIFSFKISESLTGTFESVSNIKILATNENGTVVDTVSIANLTNNGFANIANQAAYVIDGVCSAVAGTVVVTISKGAETLNDTVPCDVGGWTSTFNLSGLIQEGIFNIKAVHTGPNVPSEATRTFVRDVTAPVVAIASPAADSYIGIANQGAFTLSGTCSDNNHALAFNLSSSGGGVPVESSILCSGGAFTNIVNVSTLPDGTITAQITHTDQAGNPGSVSRNFTKNSVAPVIAITLPTISDVANASNFTNQTVEGSCNKLNGTVTLSGDVAGTVAGICDGSDFQITGVEITGADGLKTITATLLDEFGNSSFTTSLMMKATTPPVAILNGKPGAISSQEDLSITVSGTLVSSYQYKLGDNLLDCSVAAGYSGTNLISTPITDALGADGPYKICVVATDTNGNTQLFAAATEYSWTKNTTAPTVTIGTPGANSYVNAANVAGLEVTGTCGINDSNVMIQGSLTTVYADCSAGSWSKELDFSAAANGPVFILVSQEDPNTGSIGQDSRIFIKDTVVPSVAITNPAVSSYINKANRTSFTVSGTCNIYSATPNITVSGGVSDVSVACSGATWTANLSFPDETEEAIRTITATISSVSGNQSSDTRDFILDTINPTLAVTNPAANSHINLANQGAFAISGSCSDERNSSVVVQEGFTTLATVNCTTNSPNWSASLDLSSLTDGTKTLVVTHTDEAGNSYSSNLGLIKDTVAPNLGWSSPLAGACTSPNSLTNFKVGGECTNGDGDVTISSARLASSVNVACSSNKFMAQLDFVSGLNDGDTFQVTIAQTDSAGNLSSEIRTFKHITSEPSVLFGGWDDVYAIGKKTYKDGNPTEPGVVRIKWKEWPASNTCQPTIVRVRRSDTRGSSQAGPEASSSSFPQGISGEMRSFHDSTLNPSDFEKAWYYGLRAKVGEWEVDVTDPAAIAELRVVAPPQNMALVHRWITNQEVCGLFGSPTDPDNHYRCPYAGHGNIGGDVDMGNDLLVDRFELGCNVTATCGASGNQVCVSTNFFNNASPTSGAGFPGSIGSVFYSNGMNGDSQCWIKTGAANNAWTVANGVINPALMGAISTSEAHVPPLSSLTRLRQDTACKQQSFDLSGIIDYDGIASNGAAEPKRLLTQKEWRAAAAWDMDMSFPSVYSSVHEYIYYLESGAFKAGDPNSRVGKCYTNGNHHDLLSTAAREFLGGYDTKYAFETGSKIATIECQSRYGVQDMVGQMWERVSDELQCDNLGGPCKGVISPLDSNNTDMDGILFNNVIAPEPGGTSWALHWPGGAGYGQLDFNPVLGLPLMPGAVGAISPSNAIAFYLDDNIRLDIDKTTIKNHGLFLGGDAYHGVHSGRWTSNWNNTPEDTGPLHGTRCGIAVK